MTPTPLRSGSAPDRARALLFVGVASALASSATAQPQPQWTLFAPTTSNTTFLTDLAGAVVHQWTSAYRPGQAVYLLAGGDLLRTCNDMSVAGFQAGGRGGRLQRIAWDGTVEWSYLLADSNRRQHHDAVVLPGGNVLAIVWEKKTVAEAVAAGRNPATLVAGEIWSEALLEVQPSGATGGQVVWEWHAWDHLVQNFDATKPNFAPPADRPERININYPPGNGAQADWLHCNGLAYNGALDQIVVSAHNMSEVWIIPHSAGAAGDLLYRWGNPAAYGLGTAADQKLFGQHNPRWIGDGLAGAGRLLIYNNGLNRPQGAYSSVEEVEPPLLPGGTYSRTAGQPFGPGASSWSCASAGGATFYSPNISGAQRLANGNTLVCVGASGQFIEIDAACQTVWTYANTFGTGGNFATFRAERIDQRDPRLSGLLWCLADADGDGQIAPADVAVFVSAWLASLQGGTLAGDFDGNGLVNPADMAAFVNAWFTALTSGC